MRLRAAHPREKGLIRVSRLQILLLFLDGFSHPKHCWGPRTGTIATCAEGKSDISDGFSLTNFSNFSGDPIVKRHSVPGAFAAPRAFGSLCSRPAPIELHHKRGLKPIEAEKPPPPCFKPRSGSLAWDAASTALPLASMPRGHTYDQAFLSSPLPAHPMRFHPTKTTHAPSPNHDEANETILKGVHLLKAKLHAFKIYTAQSLFLPPQRRFNPTKTTHAPSPNHDEANETTLKGVHLLKAKLHAFKIDTAQSPCTGGFHAPRSQRVQCTNHTSRPSSVIGLSPR